MTTIAIDAGLNGPIASLAGSSAPSEHLADHEHHGQALDDRHERPDEERERLLAGRGRVAHDEHERLDGDPADQVAGREPEVALARRRHRDRDLGQAAGDREQDHPAQGGSQARSRLSSSSVVLERLIPAIQVAAEASTNTATRIGLERPDTVREPTTRFGCTIAR